MRKPLVSIIIVNWNGAAILPQCLESLTKIDYPNWELIFVDNGSTDKSYDLLSNSKFQILNSKLIRNKSNLGFARANNQGYKKAKGKYILLLNNDTRVTKNFLSLLVAKMESDSTIGVLQPKIFMTRRPGYLDNAGSFLTRIGFLDHWGFGQKDSKEFSEEKEIFSAKGACILIRREVIEKVDLFDDDFVSYFEESDFCWRVWLAGWRVLFYPESKIFHTVGFTIKRLDISNINYHYYKNRIASLTKNLGRINLMIILPVHLAISVGIALGFLLRRSPKNTLMIIRAILWNVFNLGKILVKRKRVQGMRRVSDRALFAKLSLPVNWQKFYADFKRVEADIRTSS